MTKRTFDLYALAAVGLMFFAFVMSALISRTVFDRLPHLEDELAYLFQARIFARGDLVIATPDPNTAYWQPFVLDRGGLRFGKYPPGWPALLAVGVVVGQAWLVNAFFAALTVGLVYRLGREVFNPETGLIAALLTAFSPMALLLNATLMAHTSALFWAVLFMYGYWRLQLERGTRHLLWGALAGAALGMLVINRPLTAVAIAAPFVLWSVVRLAVSLRGQQLRSTLVPLVALGGMTLVFSAATPLFNYAATGDPTANLYTLLWPYDRIGFGEGYGRNGHTLQKGVQFVRYDLTLATADLFGWHVGSIRCADADCTTTASVIPPMGMLNAEVQQHLRTQSGYYVLYGASHLLLLPGLLVGFRRRWAWLWVAFGVAWLLWSPSSIAPEMPLWLAAGALWAVAPLPFVIRGMHTDQRPVWTWLLFAVAMTLVGVHIAYWIGAQRYSTRYFYEALGAVAILSALPLAWVIRQESIRWIRLGLFAGIFAVALLSLANYSTPRITALHQFNRVSQAFIDAVHARRQTDQPLLVLVTGSELTWRSRGALMAETSPYMDSDIVVAWNYGRSPTQAADIEAQILARFPDREVIRMEAERSDIWFAGDCEAPPCALVNPPFDQP